MYVKLVKVIHVCKHTYQGDAKHLFGGLNIWTNSSSLSSWVMQQDNDPQLQSKSTSDWLHKKENMPFGVYRCCEITSTDLFTLEILQMFVI